MILDQIVIRRKERLEEEMRRVPLAEVRGRAADQSSPRAFRSGLQRNEISLSLIAEVKKASPSRGLIRADFDPEKIARVYEAHGASAISVLTEEDFFQGSLDNLARVRCAVGLPILRKDFLLAPYQLYEARAWGADGVLLIAAILSDGQIEEMAGIAGETGMDALVEVHSRKELDRVLRLGVGFIGINNRDLTTMKIDLRHTLELLGDIPHEAVVVTESGIETRADVERFLETRVSAMLVGTSLMKSPDIGTKIDELMGRALSSTSEDS